MADSPARIEDRIALQDVMLRYAAAVDERNLADYAALFADDVQVVGFGPETIQGRDAWVDFVQTALERFGATQHLMSPQLATVDGATARCRTDVQATHVLKGSEELFTLWATYRTDMVRGADGWLIKRHELITRASRTA